MNYSDMSDYQIMVKTLTKPAKDIFATLTINHINMIHMAMGIAGEGYELMEAVLNKDNVNIIEECGDLEFYFTGMGLVIDLDIQPNLMCSTVSQRHDPINGLLSECGNVLDMVKKFVIYNDDSKYQKIVVHLFNLRAEMDKFYKFNGITREDVLAANMRKLADRYTKGKYSDADAKLRRDKEEKTTHVIRSEYE